MDRSRSWSSLPGRYLSHSAVVLSQMAHPVLFIGKPTRKQVVAVAAVKNEVAAARKGRQRHRSVARRPAMISSVSKPDILTAYFGCDESSRRIKERLDPRQNQERLDFDPEALLKVDDDSDGDFNDEESGGVSDRSEDDVLEPVSEPEIYPMTESDGVSDFRIASSLMQEAIREIGEDNGQLGRITETIWRSYESCSERIIHQANLADALSGELQSAQHALQQARNTIAEKDGIIKFLSERIAATKKDQIEQGQNQSEHD